MMLLGAHHEVLPELKLMCAWYDTRDVGWSCGIGMRYQREDIVPVCSFLTTGFAAMNSMVIDVSWGCDLGKVEGRSRLLLLVGMRCEFLFDT